MGINIGNVTKKIQQALKPRADPEKERRAMENERIRDFEHRERMLAAEDIARAKVQREVSQVRRGKDLGPAGRPVQKKGLFHELTGSSFSIQDKPGPAKRKSGGGGGGNPLMDDLAGFGGRGNSNRRAPSQGGFSALLGMEEKAPRRSTPKNTKKKGSSGTTIIIKK